MNTDFIKGLKDKIRIPKFGKNEQPELPVVVEEPLVHWEETISADEIINKHREIKENSTRKYLFFRKTRQEYWNDQLNRLEKQMPWELKRCWNQYSVEEQCEHRLAAKETRGWFVITCLTIALVFYRLSTFDVLWLYLSFPFMLGTYAFVISLVFNLLKTGWCFLFCRKPTQAPQSKSYFERGVFTVVTEFIAIDVFGIPRDDVEQFIRYSQEDRKFKEIFEATLNRQASEEIKWFLLNFIMISVFFWLSMTISVKLNNNMSRLDLLIAPVKMVIDSIRGI